MLSATQSLAGWTERTRSYSLNAMLGDALEFMKDGINTNNPGYRQFIRLGDVPHIGKAKKTEDIANVLAAVAAGWALGLTQEVIVTGIKTFGLELPDPAALLPQRAKKSPVAGKPATARQ